MMKNPIEDMLDDERFNEQFHPDFHIRYAIFLLQREHGDFMDLLLSLIQQAKVNSVTKERICQWLALMSTEHYDFMMGHPESFLQIYDEFSNDV